MDELPDHQRTKVGKPFQPTLQVEHVLRIRNRTGDDVKQA